MPSDADFSLLEPAAFRTEMEGLVADVDGKADVDTRVGLVIVEYAANTWSGDAPAGRTNGEYPITFVPFDPDNPTDPADATNGIDTPANIRDWDRLGPTTVGTL